MNNVLLLIQSKYGSRPVHTLDEMLLLNEHFPEERGIQLQLVASAVEKRILYLDSHNFYASFLITPQR